MWNAGNENNAVAVGTEGLLPDDLLSDFLCMPQPFGYPETCDVLSWLGRKDINVFEIYGDDNKKITLTIDPIFKKEYKFEFTYELGAVEIPAVDVNSGYDDATVGCVDNSTSFDTFSLGA